MPCVYAPTSIDSRAASFSSWLSTRPLPTYRGTAAATYGPVRWKPLAVNDDDAYLVAGLMGFGIVKVADYVARPYLESRQLTQVLTDWTAKQYPILVMYPKSRHLSAKLRLFVDWVSELIQQEPILQTL